MANVIDAPRMDNTCLPPGAVAILSIDPAASVAALNDEQATLEALALPRGKYLAIVDTLFGFDSSKPIYETPLGLSFVCIGRGLPEHASASIPISPAAPSGNARPPLVVAPALPWPDCYVHTLECFYGQLARVFPCSPPREATVATEEQWDIINSAVSMDQVSVNVPMRDVYGEPVDLPDDGLDTDNEPSNYDVESYIMQGQPVSGEVVGEEQPETGLANARGAVPVKDQGEGAIPDPDPQRLWPRLDVWLDLTSTAEFGQPDALMAMLRRLTIIAHESKQRKRMNVLAKRPGTMRWAETVAAADGAVDIALPDESIPTQAANDPLIAPEDAIEHRHCTQSQPAQIQPSSTPGREDNPPQKRRKDSRLRTFLARSFESLRVLVRRLRGPHDD